MTRRELNPQSLAQESGMIPLSHRPYGTVRIIPLTHVPICLGGTLIATCDFEKLQLCDLDREPAVSKTF